jgi:hypothetical protein
VSQHISAGVSPTQATQSDAATKVTQALRACGVVAGLFVVVALVQVLTRPGFDLRRQAIGLLSPDGLGWIQRSNFVISGLLVLASAFGMLAKLAVRRNQ